MLNLLLYGGVVVSSVVQYYKNGVADRIIRRRGYKITEDNRTLMEKVNSILNDYFYILVPGYNYYKAYKLFTKSDRAYADERQAKLDDYERLISNKKEDISKIVKNKEEVKESSKLEELKGKIKSLNLGNNSIKNNSKSKSENNSVSIPSSVPAKEGIDKIISVVSNSDDMEFLYQLKYEYKVKATRLREEHKMKKLSGAPVSELNKIVSKIKIYDRVFVEARDRLEYLKNQSIQKYL